MEKLVIWYVVSFFLIRSWHNFARLLNPSSATDKFTLNLHGLDRAEASLSPPLVLDSLLGEYLRLSMAGPVEDWVLEAEELWVSRYQEMQSAYPREAVDDELYTANDAFWRLLVRRFALREQVVHIA